MWELTCGDAVIQFSHSSYLKRAIDRMRSSAGARPLNSALEIDMDFDRSLKPPPQPTEEFTSSLEDLIKRRIADQQFDDPIRREPAPDLVQKQVAELDDKQSAKVSLKCFSS